MQTEEDKIKKLLRTVKLKIESHKEFKKAYDKQLAFDFNMLDFFKVNENKISEIIAYFLNPKQTHGQEDTFLNIFLKHYDFEINELNKIACKYTISGKRRIDIFMTFNNGNAVAIENKMWDADYYRQLQGYASFLDEQTKGGFLLIYLNPDGDEFRHENLEVEYREKMNKDNCLKVASYKNDFLEIISNWIAVSEADNVTYFLKQFRRHLKMKIFGHNDLNLNKMMEKILKENREEVKAIIGAYRSLREKNEKRFDEIVEKSTHLAGDLFPESKNQAVNLSLQGPFIQPYDIPKVHASYKSFVFELKKGDERIKIELKCDFVNFYILHFKELNGIKSHFNIYDPVCDTDKGKIDVTDWHMEEVMDIMRELTKQSIENFDYLFQDD